MNVHVGKDAKIKLGDVEIGISGRWEITAPECSNTNVYIDLPKVQIRYDSESEYRINYNMRVGGGTWEHITGTSKIIDGRRETDMARGIEHERYRFNSMTERMLWTRLGKIFDYQKLRDYSAMAQEFDYLDLAIAAQAKLARLTGSLEDMGFVVTLSNKSFEQKRSSGDRKLRMMDA